MHEATTMANRLDAVLAVLQAGDVLVGHSGGGLGITRGADAAPELVSHLIYLAAALPLEGRLMQEALVYHDDGGDYDVTGMLQHLRFGDDGSMAFADVEGARALFYHDCDAATARWAFERLTPETAGDTATVPISVPRFWEAELPRSFIRCEQDHAQPRWLAATAKNAFPNSGTFFENPATVKGADVTTSAIAAAIVNPATSDPSSYGRSWVVDILAYLDQQDLLNAWDLNQPYLYPQSFLGSGSPAEPSAAPARLRISPSVERPWRFSNAPTTSTPRRIRAT